MEKFKKWCLEKIKINNFLTNKNPKEREIWDLIIWENIWFEQSWWKKYTRPVLIIKKIGILLFCIPFSKKEKNNPFYRELKNFSIHEKYKTEKSFIILSQWRVFDKKRFIKKIWILDKAEFLEIKKILKNLYF